MFLQFIKLSPVDVMRLSLGAWWPEGRSSSSVSQFLPSCTWSACQMAVRWKDCYRGDLSPWLFLQLCFCSRVVSKCFIILLVLPPLFTITLLHILYLTLVSLSFVTWAHTFERFTLAATTDCTQTPHMDITRTSSKRRPHHSVKENVKQQLLIRL